MDFEARKSDHIRLSLEARTQATGLSGLDNIMLLHEALPEMDFGEVEVRTTLFGHQISSPLFVSSMTAGHKGSLSLNRIMAEVCQSRGWPMGVGSQRRELFDHQAASEWSEIRRACPRTVFIGNIGLSQLIRTSTADVRRLADALGAKAMFVHTNPLQEALQPEGTPQFRGGKDALRRLCSELGLPVILKEVGCGFSAKTLAEVCGLGLTAVDISGLGGTHWGRIEGARSETGSLLAKAADTFQNWGIATVRSLQSAGRVQADYQVWASGGVRSGLDAAKLLAMGAEMVGFAKPVIEAALLGPKELDQLLHRLEFELRMALFCTGAKTPKELQSRQPWELV